MADIEIFHGVLHHPRTVGKGGIFALEVHLSDQAKDRCTLFAVNDLSQEWERPIIVKDDRVLGLSLELTCEAYRQDRLDAEVERAAHLLYKHASLTVMPIPVASHRASSDRTRVDIRV